MFSGYLRDLSEALEDGSSGGGGGGGGGGEGAPLIFEVVNGAVGKRTHVGVLEFSGELHGVAYLPSWCMHNLAVEEGSECTFRLRSLPKVARLRLRPAEPAAWRALTAAGDAKALLEECLRSHTAVTEGDELVVHHADAAYGFHVLDVKPENASHAADLVDVLNPGKHCGYIRQRHPRRNAASGNADAIADEQVPVAAGDIVQVDVVMKRAGVGAHVSRECRPSTG